MLLSRDRNAADRGVAVVEAAMTLALFMLLLFSIIEMGRFVQTQETVTNAAREGARLAVTPLPGTSTLPDAALVQARVETFIESAGLTGATVTVTQEAATYGLTNTSLTRVRVDLPYGLLTGLSWFDALKVTLTGDAVMRNETSS